jgi:hypothetical protein
MFQAGDVVAVLGAAGRTLPSDVTLASHIERMHGYAASR